MNDQITEKQNIETEVKTETEASAEAVTEVIAEEEGVTEAATEVTAEAEAATEATVETEAAAKEESPADPAKRSKKKGGKGKILKVLIALMGVALVCLGVFVYQLTTADARFLRDLDRGLTASWALENGEIELQNRDDANSTEFIGLEYDAVSKYRDAKFKNEELKALAMEYIDALEQCKSVADSKDPDKDFDGFWSEFSHPYGARLTAVYKIYNDGYVNLPDDDDGVMEKENLLAQGWILSKMGDIEFTRQENENGIITYTAELQNDSGFDLEFLDFEVELYTGKGKLVETVSAYAENIRNGEPIELVFYQSSEETVASYRIISEICRVSSAASPDEAPEADAQEPAGEGSDAAEDGSEEKTDGD